MTNYPLFIYCPAYSVLLFLRFHDVLSLFLKSRTMVWLGVVISCYFYCYFLLIFWKKKITKWLIDFFNLSTCYVSQCHSFCLSCSFCLMPHFLASFTFAWFPLTRHISWPCIPCLWYLSVMLSVWQITPPYHYVIWASSD